MSALFDSLGNALGALTFRLDFAALLDDNERLLKVRTALPTLALLPEHLVMREAVSLPFELVLDCISTSARFELKQLIGEQMTVSLKRADGTYAPRHDYVKQAAQLGSDGAHVRYRLTMGPWLDWLSLRTDSFVFQDKTALEIIEDVFADYPPAQWRVQVSDDTLSALRKRSLCTQYRESDLAFVSRLLAQEGLHFWFEHLGEDDSAQADAQRLARHVMVIADAAVERIDLGPIRFAAQHPTAFMPGLEDPITSFLAQRRLTTNAVARGSWDYAKLAGTSATEQTALDLGDVPTLEHYDGAGAYRYEDADAAARAAALALTAHELQAKRFQGVGAARILRPGARFALIDPPLYGPNTTAFDYAGALTASHLRADNAFTVLAVEHEASNNLGSEAARLLGRPTIERGTYKNGFRCVLDAAPVVPTHVQKPTAPNSLTALVVGVEDATVHAERGHRVKVQMHFQRGQSPNPGGLPTGFGSDATGNAPRRRALGHLGARGRPRRRRQLGRALHAAHRLRSGGAVHRGRHRPPGHRRRPVRRHRREPVCGRRRLGRQPPRRHRRVAQPAVGRPRLQPVRARRRAGPAANAPAREPCRRGAGPWPPDPAVGRRRATWRLARLGLRGRHGGLANIRAGQGLLVSTTARAGTYGSAQATQMDAAEAVAQLYAARDLGQRLGQAASAVDAQGLATHEDSHAVAKLVQAMDPTQDGKHPDTVNSQSATQPGADGRSAGDQPVNAFAQPVVVLDTPSALLAASSASLAAFAGQAFSVVAQGDLQQTAAHTSTQASGGTTSVYAHQGGILAMAANGPVSLRAHTHSLSILADQSVTITSVNDEIRVGANDEIQLVAGQSSITLKGGDIEFKTPGAFTVHGATHAFEAAASQAATLPKLPMGLAQIAPDQVVVEHEYHDVENLVGAPYRAILCDGSERTGTLDGAGQAILSEVPGGTDVSIAFGPMPGAYKPKDRRPMPDHKPTLSKSDMDALVDKYSGGRA